MNSTKNDLPEPVRIWIAAILNARLADAIDLALQAKQAHWNGKGPQFIALHELFDQVASGAVVSVQGFATLLLRVFEGSFMGQVGRLVGRFRLLAASSP